MDKQFKTYHINLDGLSASQLKAAKEFVSETTGASCSNGELVRYGIDLVNRDLNRQMSNPHNLAQRLIRNVGKYRWARAANNEFKRKVTNGN